MSTQILKDQQGRVNAVITFADIYHFKGFTFEFHRYCGVMKLKKDFEPAKREGRKFYAVISEWCNLTDDEKEKTRIQ